MAAARRDATYDEVMQERREAEYVARKAGKPELAETSSDSAVAEESADEKKKPFFLLVLAAMGPGVVSAMAGNDAGGISTYSTAGADFGYATLWVIPVMCVLLLVVQMTAARMGAVTGKGFAALIRERFGIRLTAFAMCALLIGNVATTFSEFAGIASGMGLFGVPTWASVPISAVIVWLLVVKGSYKSVEKIFLAISLVFVTYIVAAFLAGPNWGDVAHATVVPQIPANVHFVSLVISMIGTTIAPWMMFFAQSNVVDKGVGTDHEEMFLQKVDVTAGTVVACLVAWFIIVTTGAVLYPQGISIDSAQDAATALAPVRGRICANPLRGWPYRGEFPGCVRAAAYDVVRYLRSVRLGSWRRLHVEGSAHVQGHFHFRHRVLGDCGAYSGSQPYEYHAYCPVYQWRCAAGAACVHGSYCSR